MFKKGDRVIATGPSFTDPKKCGAGSIGTVVHVNSIDTSLLDVRVDTGFQAYFYAGALRLFDNPEELICEDWS